jgi:hypothetical protein
MCDNVRVNRRNIKCRENGLQYFINRIVLFLRNVREADANGDDMDLSVSL